MKGSPIKVRLINLKTNESQEFRSIYFMKKYLEKELGKPVSYFKLHRMLKPQKPIIEGYTFELIKEGE